MDVFTPVHLLVILALAVFVLIPVFVTHVVRRVRWTSCPLCLNPMRVGATRCQHCHGEISR